MALALGPRARQAEGTGKVTRTSERAGVAAAHVKVPTLLVRGELSDVVGTNGVSDLLAAIPHARHLDVAGAGHMVG